MKNLFSLLLILLLSVSTYAQTAGNLTVTVSTSETGGNYAPRNIVAIWIQDDAGNFVKTLMAYAQNRKTHLNNWQEVTGNAGSEYNTVDAITGATRTSHDTRTCTWDGTDFNGTLLADGSYKVMMELTDKNSTGNFASYLIDKSSVAFDMNMDNSPSFSNINMVWVPEPNSIQSIENDQISFYPNPTSGKIIVDKNENELISILTISGDIIYEGYDKEIDLTEQAAGIYIIKLNSNGDVKFGKIFKE